MTKKLPYCKHKYYLVYPQNWGREPKGNWGWIHCQKGGVARKNWMMVSLKKFFHDKKTFLTHYQGMRWKRFPNLLMDNTRDEKESSSFRMRLTRRCTGSQAMYQVLREFSLRRMSHFRLYRKVAHMEAIIEHEKVTIYMHC